MFQRILVPTDGSEITRKAVDISIRLALTLGAELHAICVNEPYPYGAVSELQAMPLPEFFEAQERISAGHVADVIAAAEAAGVKAQGRTVQGVRPWQAIIEEAERSGCDLLVMASHGRRGVSAVLLGSETEKVLTRSKIPVLVVR
jgi:nucleotide-binding universal stress UspA family protein